MLLKLFNQLSLVVLVDVRDLLRLDLLEATTLDLSTGDVSGMTEPNGFVLVFQEFAMHSDNLNVVEL